MREQHLTAVYAAQLALGRLGGLVRGAASTCSEFDALLIDAVGTEPGTSPGQQAATSAIELRDALQDALRLADRIDDLLTDYRKGI